MMLTYLRTSGHDRHARRRGKRLAVALVLTLGACMGFTSGPAGPARSQAGGCPHGSDRCIYVSPSGSNRDDGTRAHPVKTLQRARDIVRSVNHHMSGNVTVLLEGGTYRLSQPLTLGPRDSGSDGHDVVWAAAPGAHPVITGADRISGWRISNRAKNIWVARVPARLRTRQIYVNGMRAWEAFAAPPVKLTKTAVGYRASSPLMAKWRNPNEIEFVYTAQLGLMVEPMCPVAAIHGTAVTMAEPCWNNSVRRPANHVGFGTLGTPSYIENAYELLDEPGEFYLDEHGHVLYYIPRKGQDMRTADVEAPALQTLLSATGSRSNAVHNLQFVNLEFSYATWLQPATPTGFSEIQSSYTITGKHGGETEGLCHLAPHGNGSCPFGAWTKEPANVQLGYDRNVTFSGDRFVHLGAAGLDLDNGSQDDTVAGSVFTDISGNGIEVGNVNLPEARGSAQTKGIRVMDNHIYGLPVEFPGGLAILVGYVSNCSISHNQIDHISYAGISMGWGGWPDKVHQPPVANNSHGNVVSDNLIYDFMQALTDGGGIYTEGITGSSMANGQRVTGNVVHDQLAWGRALQSDDGSTFVTYTDNVLYNDTYDWGSNHFDYVGHPGTAHPTRYDPEVIRDNYWQQGDPNSSDKGVVEDGNKLIAGPSEAPSSIVGNGGIQPRYRSILSWQPPGQTSPNPPAEVQALYAFRGKGYVTWRPSYAAGDSPVSSYTVRACSFRLNSTGCRPAGHPATIGTGAFQRTGYAVVSGLANGRAYDFIVTARSGTGSSTPSVASPAVTPHAGLPARPGKPRGLNVRSAQGRIRLLWYSPASAGRNAVLSYRVVTSGRSDAVGGLDHLIIANNGGRVLVVLDGLAHGRRYRFSISAVDPAGAGPKATSAAVTDR